MRSTGSKMLYEALRIVAERQGVDLDDLDIEGLSVEEARFVVFADMKGRLPIGELVPTCKDGTCINPAHVIELGVAS